MDIVRFKKDSRSDDWGRRDKAKVVKTLAEHKPPYQTGIYILELEDGRQVWATEDDIEAWDQLSLF